MADIQELPANPIKAIRQTDTRSFVLELTDGRVFVVNLPEGRETAATDVTDVMAATAPPSPAPQSSAAT